MKKISLTNENILNLYVFFVEFATRPAEPKSFTMWPFPKRSLLTPALD